MRRYTDIAAATCTEQPVPETGQDGSMIVSVGAGTVRLRSSATAGARPETMPDRDRPSKYGRRRAATLATVYVLMGVHIAHWKLNGTTLAPLELNEVMYTLELGIVTAGFLFMAVAVLATAVFGRFFCSWGCHILALEDLCSWLLERVRIRPKPVRSRVLLLVPPAAMLYMFVWPQIRRIAEGQPPPAFTIHSDEEGWASFLTTDFWRNLPDPWITALTFAICGFAIIYILGSRSFCRYACPYGVVFGAVDRLAPGRIKLTGQCKQCGHCTAVCQSHVRVHEEIARFGQVVDASCLKDLDCVGGCPHGAITFGFTRPSLFRSFSRVGRRRLRGDFSLAEEGLMAVVFLAALFTFRGLYDAVPFLLTLGLGGILAYAAVLCGRLVFRRDVRVNQFRLKRTGRLTTAGRVFVPLASVFALFFLHSAFIRYHEWRGNLAYDLARAQAVTGAQPPRDLVDTASGHLTTCGIWGLFRPVGVDEKLADLCFISDEPRLAAGHLERVLQRKPTDLGARLVLARTHLLTGRPDEAAAQARRLLEVASGIRGGSSAERHRVADQSAEAHYLLAELLAKQGRFEDAALHLREVIALKPDVAAAHFNLGRIYEWQQEPEKARDQYRKAARLDRLYGDLLQRTPEDAGGQWKMGRSRRHEQAARPTGGRERHTEQ